MRKTKIIPKSNIKIFFNGFTAEYNGVINLNIKSINKRRTISIRDKDKNETIYLKNAFMVEINEIKEK